MVLKEKNTSPKKPRSSNQAILRQLEQFRNYLNNRALDSSRQISAYNWIVTCDIESFWRKIEQELVDIYRNSSYSGFNKIIARLDTDDLRTNQAECEQLFKNLGMVIIYVREGFTPEFWKSLTSVFSSNPEVIKILYADSKTTNEVLRTDDHLYYRIFSRHLVIKEPDSHDIYHLLKVKLEDNHYATTEDFDREIQAYIDTVYPKADLKREEFVDDLYDRLHTRQQESAPDQAAEQSIITLDETFIPYYKKNPDNLPDPDPDHPTDIAPDKPAPKQDPQKEPDSIILSPADRKEALKAFCRERAVLQSSDTTDGAIMLLFLSNNHNPNAKTETYHYLDQDEIEGKYTNDAPSKFLIKFASERDHQPIKTIFCLTSEEVCTPRKKGTSSDFDTYIETIKSYCRDNNYDTPNIRPLYYDFTPDGRSVTDNPEIMETGIPSRLFDMLRLELSHFHNSDHTNIYVDYTGGTRDINFLMTSIIQYLEEQHIHCQKIIYSKKSFDDSPNEIIDLGYIYDIHRMVSGVHEFITTGNAATLGDFLAAKQSFNHEITDNIIAFSQAMSLCDVSEIDQTLNTLNESIRKFEDNAAGSDFHIEMFKVLIPLIREKMFLNSEKVDYRQMISWCLDHNLLQQALTLYIEKMPTEYKNSEFNADSLPDLSGNTGNDDYFYTKLFFDIANIGSDKYWFIKAKKIFVDVMKEKDLKPDMDSWWKALDRFIARLKEPYKPWFQKWADYKETVETSSFLNLWGENISFPDLNAYVASINQKLICDVIGMTESQYKEESALQGKENTYFKKVHALKELADLNKNIQMICEEERRLELHQIMMYYLAAKLLRNTINHANEDEDTPAERYAKSYLKDNGIVVEKKVDSVKSILKAGLEASTPKEGRTFDFKIMETYYEAEKEYLRNLAANSTSANMDGLMEQSSDHLPDNDPEAEPVYSDTWKNIDIPEPSLPDINNGKVKILAQMAIAAFESEEYEGNTVIWNDLLATMKNLFGESDVPTKQELSTSGKKSPLACLLEGYREQFSRTENPEDQGKPFIHYTPAGK